MAPAPLRLCALLLLLLMRSGAGAQAALGPLSAWPAAQLWRSSEAAWATGGLADARAALQELLRRQPGDAGATAALGAVLHRAGDLERARAQYETALRLRPRDGELLMNAARLSFEMGEGARSAELYRRALDVDGSLAAGREHDVALAFHHAGEYAVAESFYRRLADQSSAAFHFDFGVTLERRGKVWRALEPSQCGWPEGLTLVSCSLWKLETSTTKRWRSTGRWQKRG